MCVFYIKVTCLTWFTEIGIQIFFSYTGFNKVYFEPSSTNNRIIIIRSYVINNLYLISRVILLNVFRVVYVYKLVRDHHVTVL